MITAIHSKAAPAAIGPYSQGIQAGSLIFLSGQIPIDPATGGLVQEDIQAATRQCLQNLAAVLAATGNQLNQIVKTTLFLTDMADFPLVNAAYAEFFPDHPPARSTIAVAALPKGARIEIEAVAFTG